MMSIEVFSCKFRSEDGRQYTTFDRNDDGMTVFDHRRLTNAAMKLDMDGLRRGTYSDKYFENIVGVMQGARAAGYTYSGVRPRPLDQDLRGLDVSALEVEAQVFTRRAPYALVAGVDAAL